MPQMRDGFERSARFRDATAGSAQNCREWSPTLGVRVDEQDVREGGAFQRRGQRFFQDVRKLERNSEKNDGDLMFGGAYDLTTESQPRGAGAIEVQLDVDPFSALASWLASNESGIHAASRDVREAAPHSSTAVNSYASVRDDPDVSSTVDADATCNNTIPFVHSQTMSVGAPSGKSDRVTFASYAQRCDR